MSSSSGDETLCAFSPTLATDSSPAPETMDPSALLIKVLSPADNFPSDLAFRVLPKSTVGELKRRISAALDFRPDNDQQRLIYRGKMLTDELVVETILGLGPGKDGGAGETPQEAYTFHLVIRPPATSPTTAPTNPFSNLSSTAAASSIVPPSSSSPAPPEFNGPTTTTTTTRSFARGGGSSVVTTTTSFFRSSASSSSANISTTIPDSSVMSLDELRQTLRQRAQNTQQPENPAAQQQLTEELARMNDVIGQRISAVRQNLSSAGRSSGISPPGMGASAAFGRTGTTATSTYGPGGIPIPSTGVQTPLPEGSGTRTPPEETTRITQTPYDEIRDLVNQQRRRALQAMQQEEDENIANFTSTSTSTRPTSTNPQAAAFPQPIQSAPTSNLISGNNLIYLLQDSTGMPTALLIGPPGSAPAPVPEYRFPIVPNFLQEFGGMGFPGAGGALNNQDLFNAGGFGFEDPHVRAAAHRQQRNRAPMNIGEVIAGVRARATHFWLAVRLAVFVVLFTGSGGWRRMLYLGSIALLIFIWQTGIFNDFLRPLIDAINPPPPAPTLPQPAPAPNTNQPVARDANGNPITPAQTANMLVARREDRFRDLIRGFERGVTIFLASIVPGLHERHVDAVEARQRERDAQEAAVNAAAAAAATAEVGEGEQAQVQQVEAVAEAQGGHGGQEQELRGML